MVGALPGVIWSIRHSADLVLKSTRSRHGPNVRGFFYTALLPVQTRLQRCFPGSTGAQ